MPLTCQLTKMVTTHELFKKNSRKKLFKWQSKSPSQYAYIHTSREARLQRSFNDAPWQHSLTALTRQLSHNSAPQIPLPRTYLHEEGIIFMYKSYGLCHFVVKEAYCDGAARTVCDNIALYRVKRMLNRLWSSRKQCNQTLSNDSRNG